MQPYIESAHSLIILLIKDYVYIKMKTEYNTQPIICNNGKIMYTSFGLLYIPNIQILRKGFHHETCYAKGQHWAEPGRKPEGGGAGSGSEAEPLMDDLII